MAIGPLFAWLRPAMIVGNLSVASIPLARTALDEEAQSVPGADLTSANRGFKRAAMALLPSGLGLGLIGAWIPW